MECDIREMGRLVGKREMIGIRCIGKKGRFEGARWRSVVRRRWLVANFGHDE
jgi:hypothetical protein